MSVVAGEADVPLDGAVHVLLERDLRELGGPAVDLPVAAGAQPVGAVDGRRLHGAVILDVQPVRTVADLAAHVLVAARRALRELVGVAFAAGGGAAVRGHAHVHLLHDVVVPVRAVHPVRLGYEEPAGDQHHGQADDQDERDAEDVTSVFHQLTSLWLESRSMRSGNRSHRTHGTRRAGGNSGSTGSGSGVNSSERIPRRPDAGATGSGSVGSCSAPKTIRARPTRSGRDRSGASGSGSLEKTTSANPGRCGRRSGSGGGGGRLSRAKIVRSCSRKAARGCDTLSGRESR